MVLSEGGINLEGPCALEKKGFGWALGPQRCLTVIRKGRVTDPRLKEVGL